MNTDATNPPKAGLKSRVLDRLRNPVQLRILVTATVLLVAYTCVYAPLSGKITDVTAELNREQVLCQLASDVEHLRTQYQGFALRLPQQSDSKEWVQYLLDGVRRFPVRLTKLDCDTPREVGPYKAAVLRVELEGSFFEIDAFLRWLESNPRLIRIDSVNIAPGQSTAGSSLVVRLTVLGMMS
jgi:Tfp pilus assembly protein PilO